MMKIPAVRGTRDFYPQQMSVRNWILDAWRAVSLRHGFLEYDGPIFEYLQLYTQKSGQEIASQLFNFEDRGGRQLALRPELTPTLARMIAAKAQSLPRPLKWFSLPRLCRAERPQRGRLREFFQWNIDVIGSDDLLADAECIFVAVDYLRTIALGPSEIEVRINSRPAMGALLEQIGIQPGRHEQVFAVMDKFDKLSRDKFKEYAQAQTLEGDQVDQIIKAMECQDINSLAKMANSDTLQGELGKLEKLGQYLKQFGIADYLVFRPSVIRGLAYYTGIVFEIFDRKSKLRALAGGGRYDNLLKDLGGPAMPAVGFGMGDVVLLELLKDLDKLPDKQIAPSLDFFIIDADNDLFDKVVDLASKLRMKGFSADFSYKRTTLVKQLRLAASRGAQRSVILGQETLQAGDVSVKDMDRGVQNTVAWEKFLNQPDMPLKP